MWHLNIQQMVTITIIIHQLCDLGQVMFWTWIVAGGASAAQGTLGHMVTEVLRRPGGHCSTQAHPGEDHAVLRESPVSRRWADASRPGDLSGAGLAQGSPHQCTSRSREAQLNLSS